jgi:hypothetical protein
VVGFVVLTASFCWLVFFMKKQNIFGILGLLFLASFIYQVYSVISEYPAIGVDLELYALRTGVSMGVSLILGFLLIKKSIKGGDINHVKRDFFKKFFYKLINKKTGLILLIIMICFLILIFFYNPKEQSYLEEKVLCESYSQEIKEEIKTLQSNPFYSDVIGQTFFRNIFYSPTLDTCLYTKEVIGGYRDDRQLIITNILTKNEIERFYIPQEKYDYENFLKENGGEELLNN